MGTVAALVLGLVIFAIVALSPGPATPHPGSLRTVRRCPLTHLPAPGGRVPRRPAIAVSVGNEPGPSRPQSGLNEADIVYDTPAEGGIMRYVVVFQCNTASAIGPTRSVRWVEWHLVQAFRHPILAFANGITYDVDTVEHLAWLRPVDLLTAPSGASTRVSFRSPPDNLYTSTSRLLALHPKDRTPPPPVFHYGGPLPRSALRAVSLAIAFSPGTDVVWKWDASNGDWIHTYAGTVDTDPVTGSPVTTKNIVVEIVHATYGRYPESPGSTGDVESQTVGSGSGYVLRDGKAISVTWHRPSLSAGTTFTDVAGKPVLLGPGRTWVELVLSSLHHAVTITR